MEALGLDSNFVGGWFIEKQEPGYVRLGVEASTSAALASYLDECVRRCFVSDKKLELAAHTSREPIEKLIAAKLPDSGSTMAGDFGEILGYLYQATQHTECAVIGPKKWRLKQDRTKPAPGSDLVQFALPSWPSSSSQDMILCGEVKTKSTPRKDSNPFQQALDDSGKDRTSRLAKTLIWLRERSMFNEIEDVTTAQISRFIDMDSHPEATKVFRAIVVICDSVFEDDSAKIPNLSSDDSLLVVISVANLKETYERVFSAALESRPS